MKTADLHLHTYFSDGTWSPAELVEEAKKAGIACIGITDHDCVSAIAPAIRAAHGDIEVVAGVELTSEIGGNEVHMLGYCIDTHSPLLKKELTRMQERRVNRVHDILGKLKEQGVELAAQEVFDMAGKGSVSRLHIAQAMFKKGIVASIPEAFGRFIGNKSPAYVGKFNLTTHEAIELIGKCKGVAVLAHPAISNCDELMPGFVEAGLAGLEAYYPEHSPTITRYYVEMAQKYNLLVTGGSDCHGKAKPGIEVGTVRIDYELVEKLKERAHA